MKKNKTLLIILPIAVALIAAICVVAFILISGEKKTDKYYEQMRTAQEYLTDGNYDKVIDAYKAAIDLQPENPDPYIKLAEIYMEEENYVEAAEITRLGYSKTSDPRLSDLMADISDLRLARPTKETTAETVPQEKAPEFVAEGEESENLHLRAGTIESLADLCYQEYVNTYGAASFTSTEDGYKGKFAGLTADVYFKNTSENRNLVNEQTRTPAKTTRPYKIVVTSPSLVFVGYNGFISYERLCSMFKTDASPIYDEAMGGYFLTLPNPVYVLKLETDSAGNMYQTNPRILILPNVLVKAEYIEEESKEEEETTDVNTFVLGSRTYTYDVVSIDLNGEYIEDMSPLRECKNLQELILTNCTFDTLEPVSGCTSLKYLVLNGSTGFTDISPIGSLYSLSYLSFHGCSQISDISGIMGLDLDELDTCFSSVSYEQCLEYKLAHPNCTVWYENSMVEP